MPSVAAGVADGTVSDVLPDVLNEGCTCLFG